MKVLVHLNHGVDRRVLYNFGRNLTRKDLVRLLKKRGIDETLKTLVSYAGVSDVVKAVEITTSKATGKAAREADAAINQERQTAQFG